MSAPNREDFESEDGFYGVGVERTADGLRLSAGTRNRDASAILSPAKARAFALAILRQADAMEPAPSLLDEYRATESERAAVLTVARAAAEDMREKAARRLEASAAEHRAAKARATPDAHAAWEQTALTLEREAMVIRDLPLTGGKS